MNYTNYKTVRNLAWRVIDDYHIDRLPVDLGSLMNRLHIKCYSYVDSQQIIKEYGLCGVAQKNEAFSCHINDSFIIFYDSKIIPKERIRFSIAHELGHIFLGHTQGKTAMGRVLYTTYNLGERPSKAVEETYADMFAARLLSPAFVLWELGAVTAPLISGLCGLSKTAAGIRAERMRLLAKRGKFGTYWRESRVVSRFLPFINEYIEKHPYFEYQKQGTYVDFNKVSISTFHRFVETARSSCMTHDKVYRFICPVCGGIATTRYSGIESKYLCVCCPECKTGFKG